MCSCVTLACTVIDWVAATPLGHACVFPAHPTPTTTAPPLYRQGNSGPERRDNLAGPSHLRRLRARMAAPTAKLVTPTLLPTAGNPDCYDYWYCCPKQYSRGQQCDNHGGCLFPRAPQSSCSPAGREPGALRRGSSRQDEQTTSETLQLGPRCREREWGRKRAGHFFLSSSFLFV